MLFLFLVFSVEVQAQSDGPQCARSIYSTASNGGAVGWSNAGSAHCDDNATHAFVDLFLGESHSQYLKFEDFGLDVPMDSRVTGIEVVVVRKSDRSSGISDRTVQLVFGNRLMGQNLAQGDAWEDVWTGAFFGGSRSDWGCRLTPAMVNDPRFGVVLDVAATGSARAEIDEVQVTVHYSAPSRLTVFPTAKVTPHTCTPTPTPAVLGM